MPFYHKVFKINYRMAQGVVRFLSHDETEFAGHAPKKDFFAHILAPSEAVALAHFRDRNAHMIKSPSYEYEFVNVERIELDACLIETRLH